MRRNQAPASSPGVSKIAPPSFIRRLVPGLRCLHRRPSSDSSHAAGSSALAVSTTSAVLTSRSSGRWHAINRADPGVRAVSPPPPLGGGCSPTRDSPSKCSPHRQRHRPHTSSRQAGFRFTGCASPLAVGRLCPPLHGAKRCLHLSVPQRALRSPRPQGIAPSMSPLCPPPVATEHP